MAITFITNRKHNVEGINITDDVSTLINYIQSTPKDFGICVDFEANGLDPYVNKPLLLAIGNKEVQFVFDCACNLSTDWIKLMYEHLIIGQNFKFDNKLFKVHYNILFKRIYDTMLADQRIYQNCNFGWGLDDIVMRHCKDIVISKEVRSEFIGMSLSTVFSTRHILYAAKDITYLHDIKAKQQKLSKALDLDWWLNNYEFRLSRVLAKCELRGWEIDYDKIRTNVKDAEQEEYKLANELDNEAKRLRDLYGTNIELIQGGKYDRKRAQNEDIAHIGLFGELTTKEFNKSYKQTSKAKANVNWNSNDEVMKLFAIITAPVPLQGLAQKQYGYLIPIIDTDTGKVDKSIGIKLNSTTPIHVPSYSSQGEGWTLDKTAIQKFMVDNPKSIVERFLKLLLKYRKVLHELSTFGMTLIEKLNPVTKRLHTTFRQAHAVNSRLQSGGGKREPDKINFQNIPREAKFRNAFRGGKYSNNKSYSVITSDLTGAEVTIMCDKANDSKLYEWAVVNDDSHSPMVQNIWRHIFLYRAGVQAGAWNNAFEFQKRCDNKLYLSSIEISCMSNPTTKYWYELYNSFIVSKKINKAYRQAGKNGTFGGIYGMKPAKAQETYNNTNGELALESDDYEPVNVTLEEGKVILIAQKRAIPKTFKMVEDNVKQAYNEGYLVLNERSKTRIWFYEIYKLRQDIYKEYGDTVTLQYDSKEQVYMGSNGKTYEISYDTIKDVDGQARNVPISGTQADIVKEAMVDIDDFIEENKLDCHLISQIHDELVYACPKEIDGHSDEYKSNPILNFPEIVRTYMTNAANRYLKNVTMKASIEVADTWVK